MIVDSAQSLIGTVNTIIPLLNGSSDSTETLFFLGQKFTKIHRYLITLYIAKHVASFSLLGIKKDGRLCFTLYRLARIAKTGFKSPIHYDRTKVAMRVYEKSKELGYVDIKKDQGETYVTTTDEGDDVCKVVLDELAEFAKIHRSSSVVTSEISFDKNLGYISKGGPKIFKPSPLVRNLLYKQLKTTHNLNKQFGESILTLKESYSNP